jgi:hypothetical protein
MCLTIKEKTGCRTAKTDIHIYKALDKKGTVGKESFYTPFRYVPVVFGAKGILVLESPLEKSWGRSVDIGIHGYYDAAEALKTELNFRDGDNTMVYHAVIPKGEKYYLGTRGDIVCSKMLVFKTNDSYLDYKCLSENNYDIEIKEIEE